MRTGLLIICCSLVIAGCKNKNKVPPDIIPQKKMQAVLWDMMRADQFLSDFVFNKDSSLDKRTRSIQLYNRVFAIHHISKEQYEKSFSFYKTHPALFKVIMDSLSTAKATAPAEMITQPVPPDSLRQHPDTFKSLRRKKAIL